MTRINLHRAILPGSKAANGQTLAEVVAIVLLIAIACLIGVRAFGKSIKCKYYSAAAQVDRHAQIAEECQADEAAPPPSSPGSPPSPGTPPEPENPQPEPPLPNPEDPRPSPPDPGPEPEPSVEPPFPATPQPSSTLRPDPTPVPSLPRSPASPTPTAAPKPTAPAQPTPSRTPSATPTPRPTVRPSTPAPTPTPVRTPTRPPVPIPPGQDPTRHHIGDGSCDPQLCGGSMKHEGLRYNKSFSVNLQQLRAAGIEFVKITFYAAGVNLTNNFVEFNNIPPGTNPVALGTMKDGLNQFIIPVSQLQATNTISLLSGGTVVGGVFNYDDIEFWDLSVTWHP